MVFGLAAVLGECSAASACGRLCLGAGGVYRAWGSPGSFSVCGVGAVGVVGLACCRADPLPGGNSRFDYASLDSRRGLLFVAHLGASQVVEINIRAGRVVRTIRGLPQVHGVLVVPALHRVYATATGASIVVRINEGTVRVLGKTATGAYPDGLAYDPANGTIWTTNESGGSETIIDAATGAPRGTVHLGGEVGNVAYDPFSGHMLVDLQSRIQLAVIDPGTRTVIRRVPLPGCSDDHGRLEQRGAAQHRKGDPQRPDTLRAGLHRRVNLVRGVVRVRAQPMPKPVDRSSPAGVVKPVPVPGPAQMRIAHDA